MTLCFDIGGTFLTVAVVGADGSAWGRRRSPTPLDDWDDLVASVAAALAAHAPDLAPDAPVCVAVAGFIDPSGGVVSSATLRCLQGRPVAGMLGAALGRPVIVVNDADAFALAEARLGAGRGHAKVFGLILGTGVGGGLVHDGALVVGARGVAGEWGHGPVVTRSRTDPAATPWFPCGCGRSGCLNTVGGARGLERLHLYLHGREAHSAEITHGWEAGGEAEAKTLDLYLELVAGPLAAIINTCGADIAPVGGGLGASTRLVEALDERVRAGMLAPPDRPLVVPAALGADAGLIGAFLAGLNPRTVQAAPQIGPLRPGG